MKINAEKLLIVVHKYGKPSDRFKFKMTGETIQTVKDQPIKCLVKLILRQKPKRH